MSAEPYRCRLDRELYEDLLSDPSVARTKKQLERLAEEGENASVRRQLLATSLRLTRGMSPQLASIADECIEKLGVEIPLETYVYASPHFNAACVKPENGRLFVMFSSSLLEAFDGPELRFVMGHELGHYLYGHHDIPIGPMLRGEAPPPPELALRLFAWSRYAEISADRAGAVCAQDDAAVARALFRLSSGLRGSAIKLRIEEFAAQVDEMQVEDAKTAIPRNTQDWFSTHPFSPLRVKALNVFSKSALAVDGGFDNDTLESRTQSLMALMEPNYLEGKDPIAETMRRFLFSAALSVASISGGVSDVERAAFEEFFGHDSMPDTLDSERLRSLLEERIDSVLESVPAPKRVQVLHDICVIARADDHIDEPERELIAHIAERLGISEPLMEVALSGDVELD